MRLVSDFTIVLCHIERFYITSSACELKLRIDPLLSLDYAVRKVGSFMTENPNASATDIASSLTSAQESVKVLFSRDRIRIFAKVVCLPSQLGALLEHVEVLIMLTESDRSLEHFLLAVMEEVNKEGYRVFPVVLAQLYEADVVAEETILEWWNGCRSGDRFVTSDEHSRLRASAGPLVSWLQEEEDEKQD
jgi:hypothetical protein